MIGWIVHAYYWRSNAMRNRYRKVLSIDNIQPELWVP